MSFFKILVTLSIILYFYFCKYDYQKIHIKILRETAAECTLFLNKNDEFPISNPSSVLLIGSGARNTIKGGLGSGDIESRHYTTCEEGLENAGFKITTKEWLNKYPLYKEKKIKEHLDYINKLEMKYNGTAKFYMISFPEYDYDLQINEQEKKADIAIYVLARNSGEGMDRRRIKGDILLTDTEIKDILYLNNNYKKFMLVLNVCGVVDLSPVKEVSNILLLSQLGVVTGDILADIILGKQNPSGKLATTWASIKDYKFINNFGNINDTYYIEGVYVGYRYFDSARVNPLYHFGYGKSYTSFSISKISLSNVKEEIKIKVKVKNIGNFDGKEVIQVYVSPSQENEDKPYQSLVAFKKTPKLKPSEETIIELTFKLRNVARYDSERAYYILDKGRYIIRVGNDSYKTTIYGFIKLNEDIITEKLKNIYKDYKIGFNEYKPKITIDDDLNGIQKIILNKNDFEFKKVDYNFEYKINDKLKKLKNEELAYMCLGEFVDMNERKIGIVGYTTKQVKKVKNYLRMADGPQGIRITKVYNYFNKSRQYNRLSPNPGINFSFIYLSKLENISLSKNLYNEEDNYSNNSHVKYQYTTAIPIETAVAQSFNTELAEKYGEIIRKEMDIYKIDIWLGPGLNIHRNILCGRNFEYYSEDPLVTGKMGASIIKSVQSNNNKGATPKHFAGNNQEMNRNNNNGRISERALREIYLKGFQIAIEESHPFSIMTSYNLINGEHTSQSKDLLIDILRNEWNFKGLIMTDWSTSGSVNFKTAKYPPQYSYKILKAGNNIMMPGSKKDYNLTLEKLKENELSRNDLLICASKVYEAIELLTK